MLALGSLAPIKKPFLRKSTSSQGFYNNYSSTAISDQKNEQGKSSMGSSDVFDTAITYSQLKLAKDTNQKVQNILNQNSSIIATLAEVMKEIHELKRSRTNNFVGEFS
jgi:hypothetical protein